MWKNNMAQIAQIGAVNRPQFRNLPTLDLASAIDNYYNAKDAETNRQLAAQQREQQKAFAEELTAQHPEAAAQIAADPMAYAKYLQSQADAERDQQFKMDMLKQQLSNSLALENTRNANAVGLAKLAAQLKGNGTTGMQNIEYLQSLGYSPEEAAQLYYAGNNPNMQMPAFGEKGFKKADENIGKNYAEDLNAYNNLKANLPALETMVKELDALADESTYTTAGRFYNAGLRELFGKTSSGDKASAAYQARVNQNLLPLLRQTFGAAFTERDREALEKTLGDPFAPPTIKRDTLNSFINNKRREIESKKRKLESYYQNDAGNQKIIDYTQL